MSEDNHKIVYSFAGSAERLTLVSMEFDGLILPPDWRCSCVI